MSRQEDETPELSWLIKPIAVLGVIAFCIFVALPVAGVGGLRCNSEATISAAQQEMVNWAVKHGYPNSTMIRAEGSISYWPGYNGIQLLVLATFEATGTYGIVKKWYTRNYTIGWYGGVEAYHYAYMGIREIDASATGKVRYTIPYLRAVSGKEFIGCDRPLQEIR